LNFLDRVSKNTQISNFIKIRPVGTEVLHADGQTFRRERQTDMTKSIFTILQNTPKKVIHDNRCYLLGNRLYPYHCSVARQPLIAHS